MDLMPKSHRQFASVEINLLPQDPFFDTPLGRTMRWALTAGRYLVIFTELVVIISFATRFSLDRQVTDLNNSIHQKVSVVESYGELESDLRLAQTRLTEYGAIENQANIVDVFANLTQVTPPDISLEKLAINATNVIIAGSAPNQPTFNTFINNLQLSADFNSISVDKIEASKITAGYDFRLRADTTVITPVRKPATKPEVNDAK